MTLQERQNKFIEKAKIIHKNENLDYSQVQYINNRTPVKIISHDLRPDGTEYGEFWQSPTNHLKGQTHPDKKGLRISQTKQYKQEDVIARFKEVHKGENLDYSQVEYKGMHVKVKIISHDLRPDGTEYGEFWQEPVVHLKGCTHPEIGKLKQIKSQTSNTEDFIRKGCFVHFDKDYSYEKTNYVTNRTKVIITCNKNDHGDFEISPDNFLQGKGCPKCGNHLSKAEDEIVKYIENTLHCKTEQRNHTICEGKELDIYIPSHKIAFEFNGLRWHSEQFNKDKWYHLTKKELCKNKGVALFHIFEDEYLYHRQALFSKIARILHIDDNLIKIGARKCKVHFIDHYGAKSFLEKNHIQGYTKATVHIGAFYEGKLISVMSLLQEKPTEWNLVRFASDISYNVQGIASKIIKYFLQSKLSVKQIKTFLDRRWEKNINNNVYTKCGFTLDKIESPDYRYTNGHGVRMHKFNFRKQKLLKKYPNMGLNKNMTENEMTQKLGYYRIWDCGLIKYVYTNPNYKPE